MIVTLTRTEDKITRMRLQGLLRKEIAYSLNRSLETVCVHMKNIYRKTSVQNEIELYNWYAENILKINIRQMLQVVVLLIILSPSILTNDNAIQRALRARSSARAKTGRRSEYEPVNFLFN